MSICIYHSLDVNMVQWRFLLNLFLVSVRDLAKFSVVLKLADLLDSFELSGIYIYIPEKPLRLCVGLCVRDYC